MNIKGYVDISLYNVETGELEHEEKTWHNAVLNSNLFMQSPFYWGSIGGLSYTSKKFVYNIVCGDSYISSIDKNSFAYPGRWYFTVNLVGATALTQDADYNSVTMRIVKKLDPPTQAAIRNIHSVGLSYDSVSTTAFLPFITVASNPTPVVQSSSQFAIIQYTVVIQLGQRNDWATEWLSAIQTSSTYNMTITNTGNNHLNVPGGFNYSTSVSGGYPVSLWAGRTGAYRNWETWSGGHFYPRRNQPILSWTGTDIANKPNSFGFVTFQNDQEFSGQDNENYRAWDQLGFHKLELPIGYGGASYEGHITGFVAGETSPGGIVHNPARLLSVGENKTQNYYGKVNSPTVPFFLVTELPSTSATITLDTSLYDPKYHEFWKIDFGGSTGGVGTAEYSFMKRYISSFDGNTFTPKLMSHNIKSINGANGSTEKSAATQHNEVTINGTNILKWRGPLSRLDGYEDYDTSNSNKIGLSGLSTDFLINKNWEGNMPIRMFPGDDRYTYNVTQKEIVLLSWLNEEIIRINVINYPSFSPSNISGYDYDEVSDTFWISCTDTGIWSVSTPLGSPSITNHNVAGLSNVTTTTENKAYTLDLGINLGSFRTVWAMIEGALVKSTDNGSTWSAYDSTSTGGVSFTQTNIEAQWSVTIGLKADKNTDGRLLIFYADDPTGTAANLYSINFPNKTRLVTTGATWWSSLNDCTNLSPTSSSFNLFYEKASPGASSTFYSFAIRYEYTTFNDALADTHDMSLMRRLFRFTYGVGKAQSTWWIVSYAEDGTQSVPAGYVPRQLFFERQLGASPSVFGQFSNPEIKYVSSGRSGGQSAYGTLRTSAFNWFPTQSPALKTDPWSVPYETVDDDNNDVLLVGTSYNETVTGAAPAAPARGFWLFRFSTGLIAQLSEELYYYHWYIGKGLRFNGDEYSQVGDQYYGWDPANSMISEIYERYVWTGSIWRLRTSDADPLTLKPTHSGTEPLIDGATISFDDDLGSSSYTSGESISAVVCDGIMNDLAVGLTTYYSGKSTYPNEFVKEVTGGVIAQNNPGKLVPWCYPAESYNEEQHNVNNPTPTAGTFNTGSFFNNRFLGTYGISSDSVGGVPINTGFLYNQGGFQSSSYPYYTKFRLNTSQTGVSYNGPVSGRYLSNRMLTTDAFSGDFLLTSSILEPKAANTTVQPSDFLFFNTTNPSVSPPTTGYNIEYAYGLADATTFTDGLSPSTSNTNCSSFSDINYGFKFRMADNYATLLGKAGEPTTFSFQTTGDTGDTLYYSLSSCPIVIEIIEAGVVKHTISGETVGSVSQQAASGNFGTIRDHELNTGTVGSSMFKSGVLTQMQFGRTFPLLTPCGLKIKRVGTTLSYEFRGQTVYTSLVSSTESLVLVDFRFQRFYSGIGELKDRYSSSSTIHDIQIDAGNDYWVQVGTSGSGNGIFNPDFLFLQVANRQAFSIKLDGVEADVVELDDAQTLVAGQVSVYPRSGLIRCAAADAGKTVTVNIPCAYLEQ